LSRFSLDASTTSRSDIVGESFGAYPVEHVFSDLSDEFHDTNALAVRTVRTIGAP
jgi:hypothetical protein